METDAYTGLDRLLAERPDWLLNGRIGLLAHPASITRKGEHVADVLAADPEVNLCRLFGPEHGFFGWGAAGEHILDEEHPLLGLPVHSLYGAHRKPPSAWLEDLDCILFDLQDLGVRCYTYLSTLFLVMQAAAEAGVAMAVLDRPITAPGMVDGPLPEERCKSFVAQVDLPFCYGLTPGEAARWMREHYGITLPALHVLEVGPALRGPGREGAAPWISPSPAIRNWTTARVYPCTVFAEAFGAVSVERNGLRPFQVWGMEDLDALRLSAALRERNLPGVSWTATLTPRPGGGALPALGLECHDVATFHPVTAALHLFHCIAAVHGRSWLWDRAENRPEFFDQLMGTSLVRESLCAGELPEDITQQCFVREAEVELRLPRAKSP